MVIVSSGLTFSAASANCTFAASRSSTTYNAAAARMLARSRASSNGASGPGCLEPIREVAASRNQNQHVSALALRTSSATRTMAARLRSTSSSVVAHDDTLMRMAVCPCHTVPPTQHVPSAWIAAIT